MESTRGTLPFSQMPSAVVVVVLAAVCFWYGVTCINGDVSVGLVAGLNLSSNGLSYALADEIGLLGLDIRSMDLGNNAIGGRLPETLSKLENLEDLYLGPNLFTSTLPSSFSQLNRLSSLYINDCVLTGSIPTELSNLSNLLALGLHVGLQYLCVDEAMCHGTALSRTDANTVLHAIIPRRTNFLEQSLVT